MDRFNNSIVNRLNFVRKRPVCTGQGHGCVRQINYFRGCDLALTIPDVMLKTQFNDIYIVVFERKL